MSKLIPWLKIFLLLGFYSFELCANVSLYVINLWRRALTVFGWFDLSSFKFVDYPFLLTNGNVGLISDGWCSWSRLLTRLDYSSFCFARLAITCYVTLSSKCIASLLSAIFFNFSFRSLSIFRIVVPFNPIFSLNNIEK